MASDETSVPSIEPETPVTGPSGPGLEQESPKKSLLDKVRDMRKDLKGKLDPKAQVYAENRTQRQLDIQAELKVQDVVLESNAVVSRATAMANLSQELASNASSVYHPIFKELGISHSELVKNPELAYTIIKFVSNDEYATKPYLLTRIMAETAHRGGDSPLAQMFRARLFTLYENLIASQGENVVIKKTKESLQEIVGRVDMHDANYEAKFGKRKTDGKFDGEIDEVLFREVAENDKTGVDFKEDLRKLMRSKEPPKPPEPPASSEIPEMGDDGKRTAKAIISELENLKLQEASDRMFKREFTGELRLRELEAELEERLEQYRNFNNGQFWNNEVDPSLKSLKRTTDRFVKARLARVLEDSAGGSAFQTLLDLVKKEEILFRKNQELIGITDYLFNDTIANMGDQARMDKLFFDVMGVESWEAFEVGYYDALKAKGLLNQSVLVPVENQDKSFKTVKGETQYENISWEEYISRRSRIVDKDGRVVLGPSLSESFNRDELEQMKRMMQLMGASADNQREARRMMMEQYRQNGGDQTKVRQFDSYWIVPEDRDAFNEAISNAKKAGDGDALFREMKTWVESTIIEFTSYTDNQLGGTPESQQRLNSLFYLIAKINDENITDTDSKVPLDTIKSKLINIIYHTNEVLAFGKAVTQAASPENLLGHAAAWKTSDVNPTIYSYRYQTLEGDEKKLAGEGFRFLKKNSYEIVRRHMGQEEEVNSLYLRFLLDLDPGTKDLIIERYRLENSQIKDSLPTGDIDLARRAIDLLANNEGGKAGFLKLQKALRSDHELKTMVNSLYDITDTQIKDSLPINSETTVVNPNLRLLREKLRRAKFGYKLSLAFDRAHLVTSDLQETGGLEEDEGGPDSLRRIMYFMKWHLLRWESGNYSREALTRESYWGLHRKLGQDLKKVKDDLKKLPLQDRTAKGADNGWGLKPKGSSKTYAELYPDFYQYSKQNNIDATLMNLNHYFYQRLPFAIDTEALDPASPRYFTSSWRIGEGDGNDYSMNYMMGMVADLSCTDNEMWDQEKINGESARSILEENGITLLTNEQAKTGSNVTELINNLAISKDPNVRKMARWLYTKADHQNKFNYAYLRTFEQNAERLQALTGRSNLTWKEYQNEEWDTGFVEAFKRETKNASVEIITDDYENKHLFHSLPMEERHLYNNNHRQEASKKDLYATGVTKRVYQHYAQGLLDTVYSTDPNIDDVIRDDASEKLELFRLQGDAPVADLSEFKVEYVKWEEKKDDMLWRLYRDTNGASNLAMSHLSPLIENFGNGAEAAKAHIKKIWEAGGWNGWHAVGSTQDRLFRIAMKIMNANKRRYNAPITMGAGLSAWGGPLWKSMAWWAGGGSVQPWEKEDRKLLGIKWLDDRFRYVPILNNFMKGLQSSQASLDDRSPLNPMTVNEEDSIIQDAEHNHIFQEKHIDAIRFLRSVHPVNVTMDNVAGNTFLWGTGLFGGVKEFWERLKKAYS